MTFLRGIGRAVALPVALAMVLASMPLGAVQAGLVPTEQVIDGAAVASERAKVTAFLARAEVRRQMAAFGVDVAEAQARVAGLSDAEVRRIAGRIDELPAGEGAAGAIIGVALIVFLVLLVTDLMGYTNVFPFTKKGSAQPTP